jgi:chromosome partitioning protein
MRSIALINQKGGVAKTTTTVNLGAALAARGKRVLVADMDPQANLTSWLLGHASEGLEDTMAEVLQGRSRLGDVITQTRVEGLDLIPADLRLTGLEKSLAGEIGGETILQRALDQAELAPPVGDPNFDLYDYLLIDCPPSVGMLTVNALCAVQEVVIPVQAHVLSLNGVASLMQVIEVIQSRLHPELEIAGVLLTMVNRRTKLSVEIEESARRHFGDLVFKRTIRECVRLAECPSHFAPIHEYAATSTAARDYFKLADEVIAGEKEAVRIELPDFSLPEEIIYGPKTSHG